jgi:hypothetical protein
MGIPWQSHPGTYGRVEARHALALDDDVLEDLVDRVPDVDVAIGVRGPIVQDEARTARRSRRGSLRTPSCAAIP